MLSTNNHISLTGCGIKKNGVVLPQFEILTEFYISHHVAFHLDDLEKVIIEEMTGTFYPIDHVHIGLQVIMYALSIMGMANHPNCEKAWVILESKKDSDGKFLLDGTLNEPYFNVGKVGNPNKWVTLYVLLSEKYCRN